MFIDTGLHFECDASCYVPCDSVTCDQFHRSAGHPGHQQAGADDVDLHLDVLFSCRKKRKRNKKIIHISGSTGQVQEIGHSDPQSNEATEQISKNVANSREPSEDHKSATMSGPSHVPSGAEVVPQVCLLDSRTYENTLHVQIGKIASSALVDTGATISCISENLLNKIHPKYVKYQKSDISFIVGVGGKQHDVSHKVEVQMKIKDKIFTQSFYSLQNQIQLILGMDFITGHKALLDFEKFINPVRWWKVWTSPTPIKVHFG